MKYLKHKIQKFQELIHKIRDYDSLKQYESKVSKELKEYKNEYNKKCIEHDSYKARYEQELRHRKILDEKLLTSSESKYDSIGLPKLDIKQLKAGLKLADKYTLSQVVELLKIDYIDTLTGLGNALEDQNKYEVSISLNAIRRRTQQWIGVFGEHTKEENPINRATGKPVEKEKKK